MIIAAVNEQEGIGPTISEVRHVLDNPSFLVVDGRSTDATTKIAKSMDARIVYQKGSGKGDAVLTALEHARTSNPKYVILVDADFTYPAEYLPKMIKVLEENPTVGMVCGNRFNDHFHLKGMTNMYYAGNRFLAFIHNVLNGVSMRDPLTGLRIVRWEILRDWKPRSGGFDVEVELNHFVERKGYMISEIPIHYRQRLGEKKLKLRHGFTIFRRILLESM